MSDFAVKIILSASSPLPSYDVTPWDLGTLEASSGDATTGDSYGLLVDCSPVGEYADIAQGGNCVAVDSWTFAVHAVTPGRVKWWDAFRASGASMYGARVELWDVTNDVCRAVGVVTDASLDGVEVRIECESILTARHRDIPARRLTDAEFPGISDNSIGRPIPEIYGKVTNCTPPLLASNKSDYIVTASINFLSTIQTFLSSACASASASQITINYAVFPVLPTFWQPLEVSTIVGDGFWLNPDTYGGSATKSVYVEITSGKGAGQKRRVIAISSATLKTTKANNFYAYVVATVASPWDDIPDKTSVISVYGQNVAEVIAACDEGEISRVHSIVSGNDFVLPFHAGETSGIKTADISSEFFNGEDYSAFVYVKPSENYSSPWLTDGKSLSEGNSVNAVLYGASGGVYSADVFCRAKVSFEQIPHFGGATPDVYALFAFKSNTAFAQSFRVVWAGRYFDASEDFPDDRSPSNTLLTNVEIGYHDILNAFTLESSTDGEIGNFEKYAVKLDLPRDITAYESIRFGVVPVGTLGEPVVAPNALVTEGNYSKISIPAGYGGDLTGKYIKIMNPTLSADPKGLSGYWRDRFFFDDSTSIFASSYTDWYKISSWAPDGSGRVDVFLEAPLDSSTFIYGTYAYAYIAAEADFVNFTEYESGIAFLYGNVSPGSEFLVDYSSGRTFSSSWPTLPSGKANGDPITLARDAALDTYYRSLGLAETDVDFDSFQALPADAISAALVDVEQSDNVIARMAHEFNWIVAHDGTGRERGKSWLSRLWTEAQDWTVANADIVADSMQQKTTALDDVICQPSLFWSWTQADGFRASAIVSDVTVDPDSLTEANYKATISGFDDLAESKAILENLQTAYSSSLRRGEKDLEWKYGGDPMLLYTDSNRLWWAASRKRLLDFKIPENHAAMASVVGDRVEVTHRRATAGSAVYGTLAGRWWHPVEGTVQLLVMLDPPPVGAMESGLFVDTIDPSGTIEKYIDQRDGTSEQYIDTVGA